LTLLSSASLIRLSLVIVVDDLHEDKKGRKALEVPCEEEVMLQALKALIYVQERQNKRRNAPNMAEKLRGNGLVPNAVKVYAQELIFGAITSSRNVLCRIRDAYSVTEHIRMLLYLFIDLPSGSANISAKRVNADIQLTERLREHFCHAARHSMFLRDEDLRGLNLTDCFMDQVNERSEDKARSSGQTINMLLFTFYRSKTNRTGKQQFGASWRHADVRRCAVGAFASYLFHLWKVSGLHQPEKKNES